MDANPMGCGDNYDGATAFEVGDRKPITENRRSMVPNSLHILPPSTIFDRMLGKRIQIQNPSTTLLPAFYHLQSTRRRNMKVNNPLICPNCGTKTILTPIIHTDITHISYVCHGCKKRYNKPEYPQKQLDRWL
jgi:DNA-directed RNA polymerase subunit RPC12/RpoP